MQTGSQASAAAVMALGVRVLPVSSPHSYLEVLIAVHCTTTASLLLCADKLAPGALLMVTVCTSCSNHAGSTQ